MKYAIIIPDGAADEPLKELGGKTPLEAAHTPNMDRVAAEGRHGTGPHGAGRLRERQRRRDDVLLGYDPAVYHTGRAPLEAAAQQIPLAPTDWVFRCNLVTVVDGIMKDHSAGGISNAEARQLHRATWPRSMREPGFEFYQGVSYRNLLVYRGHAAVRRHDQAAARDSRGADRRNGCRRGKGSEILRRIMDRSREPVRQPRDQPRPAGDAG